MLSDTQRGDNMQIQSLVGYTSSKKAIYQYDTSDPEELSPKIAGFSQEDHFDAVAVFSYLQLVYWRKLGENSDDFENVTNLLRLHDKWISDEFRRQQYAGLGISTAFDLSKYGRKHCVPYLQELL
jgi:hypothetical protein